MSDPGTIIIFCLVAFGSLFIVSMVNQQQTRSRLIAHKVVQLKRRISDIEEMAASLETLVESPGIARVILEESLEVIDAIDKLEPGNHFSQPHRMNAEKQIEELFEHNSSKALYRVQPSDAAIARSQYLLNEAATIIRKRQAAGKIELTEMETYISDLAWANLMVVVITHLVQGHKAVTRGDVLRAYAFYKKAQQCLLQASICESKRHAMIKEIGELMSNKRKSLSPALMPETQFNPSAESAELVLPEHHPDAPGTENSQDQKAS